MRVGLLSSWASRLGGGVFEAVVNHGHIVKSLGLEPILFALGDSYSATDSIRFPGEVQTFAVRGPSAFGYAPGLLKALLHNKLDLLHLHGIWQYPSLAGALWARRTGQSYFVSPHGMLDPWIVSHGKAKKLGAMASYERLSWSQASRFHALTNAEASDVESRTRRSAVSVIPNSVHLVGVSKPRLTNRRVVSLGRIHPKKNLDSLVYGWLASEAHHKGWQLTFAGWGEPDHVNSFKGLIKGVSNSSICFLGPTFGKEKEDLLSTASFFALPSLSEGLPLALLEAWSAGIPTIQSVNCNLPEGIERGAGILTGTEVSEIAQAISSATNMDSTNYSIMSEAATRLAHEKFSREAVARQWANFYSL